MLPLLFLVQDLTCAELQQVAASGVPAEGLVGLVETRGVPAAELACVQAAALPETVKVAAAHATVPMPVTTPLGSEGLRHFEPVAEYKLDGGLRRWLATDACSPVQIERTTPEPGVAMALSGLVGFGSGHFYAHQSGAGAAFLLTEAGGTALTSAGIHALGEGKSPGLFVGGAVVVGLLHIFDFATAYQSAVSTRDDAYAACGW